MLERIIWKTADAATRKRILSRPSESAEAFEAARGIVDEIRAEGETAVRRWAQDLDDWAPESFGVAQGELDAAEAALAEEDREAILAAADAVRRFHAEQGYRSYEVETWPGGRAQRRVTPIDVAGLYVPAGTAPLVSTLVMLTVPAQLAGVARIAVIAPPRKGRGVEPTLLGAAKLLGVEEVYAIGGAHGVAALGYGVAGLPRADRIFGPGNAYVAAAKAILAQSAGGAAADLPAGPSEVMVIADDTADAAFVASDLLSQAEHDAMAQVILVAFSTDFVAKVEIELEAQLAALPREATARAALANSRVLLVESDDEAVEAANAYAAEHLIVQTQSARALSERVRHAGSVFLGPWTPEAAGDYAAGPNHSLPTAGAARAYGGVTVEMFQKTTTVLELSREAAAAIAPTVERLAALEGLDAHRIAMRMRREKAQVQ